MTEFTISFRDWCWAQGWIEGFIIGYAKGVKKRLAKMVDEGGEVNNSAEYEEGYAEREAKDYYQELERGVKGTIHSLLSLRREPQKIVGQIMRKYKLPRSVAKYYVDEIYRKNINNT